MKIAHPKRRSGGPLVKLLFVILHYNCTCIWYRLKFNYFSIRLRACLLLLYKAANQAVAININKFIPNKDQTHHYRTRQTSSTSSKRISAWKDCYEFSFLPRTTVQWNSLPASIRQSPTIYALKHQLNSNDLLQLTGGGGGVGESMLFACFLALLQHPVLDILGVCTVANRCRLRGWGKATLVKSL